MNDKVEYDNDNLDFDQDENIILEPVTGRRQIQRIDNDHTSPNHKGRVKMELNDFIKYFGNLEIGKFKIKI